MNWYELVDEVVRLLTENIIETGYTDAVETGHRTEESILLDDEVENFTDNLEWEIGKRSDEICMKAKKRIDALLKNEKNVRSKSRKVETPDCPKCHKHTTSSDMKYNGYDDEGNLYESYRCPHCGTRFTISYEGDDEDYEWWYDMDSIESPSPKAVKKPVKAKKTSKTSVKPKKAAKKPANVKKSIGRKR